MLIPHCTFFQVNYEYGILQKKAAVDYRRGRANDFVSGENEARDQKATGGAQGVVKTITCIMEELRR
ncbi:MAG TPA: hypothetical protein ENI12_02500 [Nitrospirae bacterium]|nr:hypothetical protein [Nitrospirota bacterium]